jgi:hypothetical protein
MLQLRFRFLFLCCTQSLDEVGEEQKNLEVSNEIHTDTTWFGMLNKSNSFILAEKDLITIMLFLNVYHHILVKL